jgi:hypothetical protein
MEAEKEAHARRITMNKERRRAPRAELIVPRERIKDKEDTEYSVEYTTSKDDCDHSDGKMLVEREAMKRATAPNLEAGSDPKRAQTNKMGSSKVALSS